MQVVSHCQTPRVQQWISAAEGGTINLTDKEYSYTLTFPPGALDQDTGVSITLLRDDEAQFTVDFEPHGTVFNLPVDLDIVVATRINRATVPEIPTGWIDIYYLNEDIGLWEDQAASITTESGKANTLWIRVHGHLHHFSRYALGSDNLIQKAE